MKSPLHLYVHIPYCLHKCAYCDFNSHAQPRPPWDDYLKAVRSDIAYRASQPRFKDRQLNSIYFGGGTPSLAPASLIRKIMEETDKYFSIADNIEISLEANPGVADSERLTAYREAGVNRLSIGAQSFRDDELAWLERIHSAKDIKRAFQTARLAGFKNISLDLIYGLPGQNLETWLDSLKTAIDLKPEHFSCYQLTIEPHTLLAARHNKVPLKLPNDEQSLDFLFSTRKRLEDTAYEAYEISSFCRAGFRCRHNDAYWLYDDYIGIGPGASGKWDKTDGDVHRYTNIKRPDAYIQASQSNQFVGSEEILAKSRAAAEAVWLGLRRRHGIRRDAFSSRFDADVWSLFSQQLQPWLNSGHLHLSRDALSLTDSGLTIADSIALSLI
ncbi:MAG: radical SAM family heme chaperone HemW [Mariprofundaceae bacterium]